MTSRLPHRALVVLLLASPACATLNGPPASAASSDEGAALSAVLDGVRAAIVEAETPEVPGFPPLKAISVKLQTTVSRSLSGQVKYLVVGVGAAASAETTSTLELDMRPPEIPHRAMRPYETWKDALANAIHLAKLGVAEASKGDPPLSMKSISIDLKFAVEVDGSAAAGVKIIPIGLAGAGKISRGNVHTVSLTFGS